MTATGLTAHDLMQHGLMIDSGPSRIGIELRFERPAFVYGHRLKGCSIGAFTYFNAAGTSSAYRCNIGRYAQIGESSILGPPEHPMDWFSSHPFTFTRPKYMPNMYRFEDFARLAPDAQEGPSYADSMPIETTIGHEAYVGVSSFIKRGVRIGHGAVVGAKSIVTRDVPDYAIVVGSPAKVVRMRFAEPIVERFLKLQWWLYDLAPHKNRVDFSKTEAGGFNRSVQHLKIRRIVGGGDRWSSWGGLGLLTLRRPSCGIDGSAASSRARLRGFWASSLRRSSACFDCMAVSDQRLEDGLGWR